MQGKDDAGEVLEDVARIHPVVDRLRELLTSAAILDLKGNSQGYWTRREEEPAVGR